MDAPASRHYDRTGVVLRERSCRRGRCRHVAELRVLQLQVEGIRLRWTVQHRCHPPGEVLAAPNTSQAGIGIRAQPDVVAALVEADERLAEQNGLARGEVEPLR